MSQEWIAFISMGRIEMGGWDSGREVGSMQGVIMVMREG
jgi:hypothetical protein